MKLRILENPKGWTPLPNRTFADDEISFRALGILGYLLSRPPGWETDSKRLAAGARREGRDAIRTALKELEQRGYLHRVKVRRPAGLTLDGRYVGGQITTEYFVSDHPSKHPGEVLDLVDTLAPDVGENTGDWKSGPGDVDAAKTGDNPVDTPGDNLTPGPGKPGPENPAPLTRPEELDTPPSSGELTTFSTGEADDGLSAAGSVHPMLAALAESDAPIAAALSATLAIEKASHLEPRVQMFALRAHLTSVLRHQPTFDDIYGWVERAHESTRPAKRGRLTTGELVAYVASFSSPPEPESSGLAAAALPGGLPAAEGPASRPGELGDAEVAISEVGSPARLGAVDG